MPSTSRAGLSSVDLGDLSDMPPIPLSGRNRVMQPLEPVSPVSIAAEAEPVRKAEEPRHDSRAPFPSLQRAPRERMVSFSMRVPIRQIEALEQVCQAHDIDVSSLVRDFIEFGLAAVARQDGRRKTTAIDR